MSNKMLIDASHPEETRVAVVRGNRIEEFDFESQEKKQLRGNIYLAKVTRVEPSLQAAFVDYGGNRHGFLAFSEIHPDYYQIPVADRQALLDADADDARASREAEEEEDNNVVEVSSDDDEEDEAPKKKPRRRRSKKAKTTEENSDSDVSTEEAPSKVEKEPSEPTAEVEVKEETDVSEPEVEKPKRTSTRRKIAPVAKKQEAVVDTPEEVSDSETVNAKAEPEEKPKRRTTRRKKAPVAETSSEDETSGDDGNPTTMAAMVEMDSISEPLPEDADEPKDDNDASDDEPVAEEKPKRRSTRKKAAPKKTTKAKAKEEDIAEASEEVAASETATAETQAEDKEAEAETEKPKKRAPRRSSRKKKETAAKEEKSDNSEETSDADNGSDDSEEEGIESVGQEDALEEVPTPPRRQRRHYKIQEVIKRHQVLLVQVVKEERGNKGAALTTYLSLAGRYSVLMPNTARGGGISRKITNAADRKRLKAVATGLEVPQGMGVILRTAGASRTNAEIERDFDYLMRLWEQVRNLTLSSSAPCLVYEEGSLIKRSIRDLYDKDTGEVLVAGENGFQEAKDFMTMLMPTAANRVKLHRDKQAIFAKFGVETQLDKMVTPQVTLKSGGYLIIDQTEALVAVDVNSGRSTREHSIENTALQTNLEAAEEVSRQLRLRDLAGLIVIDFIDMEEKRNNRAVEKKLKDSLKNDRARIQVGRISHFGLMEMSRQRMRASVLESTMDVCSLCSGTGHVRSDSAIALHVFRAIEEHVSKHNRYDAAIKTTPAIAIHLLNNKRAALLDLENRHGLSVMIEGSTDIKGQDFTIEKGEIAHGDVSSNAVGFQNSPAENGEVNSSDETEEKNNGGRKRGRGRGRHKNRDEENQETSEETNEEVTVASNNEDDNNDDQPRKKRRRGKRGGRRRSNEEAAEVESSEASSEADASSETAAQSSSFETEPEAAEEKPKSRSTTRRKAAVSKPAELTAVTAPVERTSQEPAQEQEKPKPRRTTRRKKPSEAEAANEDAPSQAQPSSAPQQSAEMSSDNSEELQDGEKKKKGWWNRGGGFF